jgi:hypothetical protein
MLGGAVSSLRVSPRIAERSWPDCSQSAPSDDERFRVVQVVTREADEHGAGGGVVVPVETVKVAIPGKTTTRVF